MTDEQEKIFLKKFDDFIDETRNNFAQIFRDRQHDFEHIDRRTGDIYMVVGNLKNEAHLMTDKVEQSTKTVEDKMDKAEKTVVDVKAAVENKLEDGMESITQTLKGKHMFNFIKKAAKQDSPVDQPKKGFLRSLWPF